VGIPGAADGSRRKVVRSRNDVYQWIDVLKRNRAKRRKHGEFLVEGVVPIDEALARGWPVHAVIYDGGRPLSAWARDVLRRLPEATQLLLSAELLADVSDREETSELLLVVGIEDRSLAALDTSGASFTVVLDRPSNPGNLGSIVRSCSAFGASGVVLLGHAADPYDARTVRASLGAVFSVPFVVNPPSPELDAWLAGMRAAPGGLRVVGADPAASVAIDDVDFTGRTVLLLGNEKLGLGARLRTLCDLTFAIPMSGAVDSLNVAAAATVVLYEASRQRRRGARAGLAPP
jgi:tRNA G18 (ribose-2'-O)-methylase SpoU